MDQRLAARADFVDCREFSAALSRCHLRWDLRSATGQPGYRASLKLCEYGDVVFAEVEHDPIHASRRAVDINRRDLGVIGLTLFTEGSMVFGQRGRELSLQSNELFLWDGKRPGDLSSLEAVKCKTMLFPRPLVSQHIGDIDDLTGRKLGLELGGGALLKSHIEAMHESFDQISPRDRLGVLRATLDLVGVCFRSLDATPRTGTQHQKVLFRHIEDFMRDALLEPDFNPTTVAQALGITPRYLHRLFSEAGTTFSEWVRLERLTRAEKALTSPSFAAVSIEVAAEIRTVG